MVLYFDQVEADLLRYYQVDLPAALWGDRPVSARRLAALVRSLPPDSATVRVATAEPSVVSSEGHRRGVTSAADIEAVGGNVIYVGTDG